MKIPLNECASLVRLDNGNGAVLFEKQHYKSADLVPIAILGENFRLDVRPEMFRASHFVKMCMRGKFGPVDQWPTAAAEFVYPTGGPFGTEIKILPEQSTGAGR